MQTLGEQVQHASGIKWLLNIWRMEMMNHQQFVQKKVIRKALQKGRSFQKISNDYFQGVLKLKELIPDYVHDMGQEKFFIHLWSSIQLDLYKKMVNHADSVLHIDATDGIVTAAINLDGSQPQVFYYAATMNGIPVTQMLSARQNTPALMFWLMSW